MNRQCSSGLQAVANIAQSIAAGEIDVGLAVGVESMTEEDPNYRPRVNYDGIYEHPEGNNLMSRMGDTSDNGMWPLPSFPGLPFSVCIPPLSHSPPPPPFYHRNSGP